MNSLNINSPTLVLAVSPDPKVRLDMSFYDRNHPAVEILRNPQPLRILGWNLRTLDEPHLKDGNHWEVRNSDRKLIKFYNDATFISFASCNEDFLGWGSKGDNLTLNTLAVIEYIYEFVETYRKLTGTLNIKEQVNGYNFVLRLVDPVTQGMKLQLIPYGTRSYGFMWGDNASVVEKDLEAELEVGRDYKSEYIAYNLLANLWVQFGVSLDVGIPYSSLDEEKKGYINTEQIRKVQ